MSEWTDIVNEEMTFVIPDSLLIHLESWVASANGREVSGVGIMEADPEEKTFTLKKVWLMAAGSVAYTEIPGDRMQALIKEGVRPDLLKVWWHRHPVGNGVTGPHNWSGRDNQTIRDEPFGIDPSMVKWLLSIVRTPSGWVARYDNHIRKETTHMPVRSRISRDAYVAASKLINSHIEAERKAQMAQNAPRQTGFASHKPFRYDPPKKVEREREERDEDVFEQLELYPGGFGLDGIRDYEDEYSDMDIAERCKEAGWDRETYVNVARELKYELPEFVAFDRAVTIQEMFIVGLITQGTVAEIRRRIQIKVDQGKPDYIQLIANWDVIDDG